MFTDDHSSCTTQGCEVCPERTRNGQELNGSIASNNVLEHAIGDQRRLIKTEIMEETNEEPVDDNSEDEERRSSSVVSPSRASDQMRRVQRRHLVEELRLLINQLPQNPIYNDLIQYGRVDFWETEDPFITQMEFFIKLQDVSKALFRAKLPAPSIFKLLIPKVLFPSSKSRKCQSSDFIWYT